MIIGAKTRNDEPGVFWVQVLDETSFPLRNFSYGKPIWENQKQTPKQTMKNQNTF